MGKIFNIAGPCSPEKHYMLPAAAVDPARRLAVARAGRERYLKLFNAQRVLNYIRETVFALPYSEPCEWANEVYRHVDR